MIAPPFARPLPGHGVIEARGAEFPELLHRLSTQATADLRPGLCRETLLVTEKARFIDAVLAVMPAADETLLLVSPDAAETVLAWLGKYTIMEDVSYADVSARYVQYELTVDGKTPMRPGGIAIPDIGSSAPIPGVPGGTWLRHDSVQGPGLRFLIPRAGGGEASLSALLHGMDIPLVDEETSEIWRIARGYPASGRELTDRVNPLEAGAERAVNSTKGCYIGQEVLARLGTYNKVQRALRRVLLRPGGGLPPGGSLTLFAGDAEAGFVGSISPERGQSGIAAIACVRLAHAAEGTLLEARGANGACEALILGPAPVSGDV